MNSCELLFSFLFNFLSTFSPQTARPTAWGMDEKIVARRSPVLSLSSIHNSASDVIIYQLRAIIFSPLHGDDQKMTKKFLETPLRIYTELVGGGNRRRTWRRNVVKAKHRRIARSLSFHYILSLSLSLSVRSIVFVCRFVWVKGKAVTMATARRSLITEKERRRTRHVCAYVYTPMTHRQFEWLMVSLSATIDI